MELTEVPMHILDVTFSDMGFIVFLKPDEQDQEKEESIAVPIFIGIPEAQLIAIQFNKVRSPRPLIMDLFYNTLNLLHVKVTKILISDLIDNTFYGKVFLEDDKGGKFKLDARSSDAIILALRFNAKIFIKKSILEQTGIYIRKENFSVQKKETIKSKAKTKLEVLEEELKKALEEERYEDAARIRDEIRKNKGESN